MMNYIDRVVELLQEHECMQLGCDGILLRLYALLVLTTGTDTMPKDVHDAWSAWCSMIKPQHKSLVPFEQLDKATQDLDWPYAIAIAIANVRWQLDRSSKC